jgi:integrase
MGTPLTVHSCPTYKALRKVLDSGGRIMPSIVGKVYEQRGRWHIRLKGGVRVFCDKRHRSFYSQQEAEYALSQICAEIENGTFDEGFYSKSKKSLLSFSVYAAEWLSNCEKRMNRGELAPTYIRSLRQFVNKIFIPYFGDVSMLEIKGRQLKSFYLSLDQHPKTVLNIMAALKKIFTDALSEEVIPQLPNFPKIGRVPEPSWQWIDEELQDKILTELDPDSYYAIFFLMCHGCRTGELRALKHKDIDLQNETVTIRRSVSGDQVRETTKSKRSRTIPLDAEWKELYLQKPTPINNDMFVFTKNGDALSHTWLSKRFRSVCDHLGINNLTLYQATRHSLASQAANRGESLYLIGKMLGHSTSKMTERYSHVETNALKQISRKSHKNVVSNLSANKKVGSK